MSKSQAVAFFEEISKNNKLAKEVEKVVGGKTSDEAKAKDLISLAKTHRFNFTQEDAIEAQSELKKVLLPEEMLEVSGGDEVKSSVMAMALLACLGGSVSTLSNIETSAMKTNHQQASPQTQTEFREDPILAWFNSHCTTTYFDDSSAYFGDNSAYFDESSVPNLYGEQPQDGNEHADEMSFDEDFEDGDPFEEYDEMEAPSGSLLAPEATQEQYHGVPYVFLNYHGKQLYMGDISETLEAYGAVARIAALPPSAINCKLKLYCRDLGCDSDSYFNLNFDISEGAVLKGTGLLIVGPDNTGLCIHFKVQESQFRNRILLCFEKVEGEVKVPDNWGIFSIDSSSFSTPQLVVNNLGDICFTTKDDFGME